MVNNYTLANYQEDYKVRYEVPSKHTEICNQVKGKIHNIVVTSVNAIKGPNLVMKVARSIVKTLGYIPELNPNLAWTNGFLKDCKTISNWINGTQSIDTILNGKFSWKIAALTVSGLALFTLSNITMAEKLLINCNTVKASLAVFPALRSLPFGGLLNISLLGLFGSLLSLSLDKGGKFVFITQKNDKKIEFWRGATNEQVIQKYRLEDKGLKVQIKNNQEQLKKAKSVISEETRQYKMHQEATVKLESDLVNLQQKETRSASTAIILTNREGAFKEYQEAKLNKWELKQQKANLEKGIHTGSNINFGISVSKQLAILMTVGTGYGLSMLSPFLMLAGLASVGISIRGQSIKNEIRDVNTHIKPVRVS